MTLKFPPAYTWLNRETGPLMLLEALIHYGTMEAPGAADNPVIMKWAKEIGGVTEAIYTADSVPWCGLFMAVCAKRAGQQLPPMPLRARSWETFGQNVSQPMLGDVLVFTRSGGGHVGLYVGEDSECFHVLGANQNDAVNIMRIARNRLSAARRCQWRFMQPWNIRQVLLAREGSVSKNEQ